MENVMRRHPRLLLTLPLEEIRKNFKDISRVHTQCILLMILNLEKSRRFQKHRDINESSKI